MKRSATAFLVAICFVLVSCASTSWQTQARSSVVALTDVWDVTMQMSALAYHSGGLTEAKKDQIIEIGEATRLSLLTAARAIDASNTQDYSQAIASAIQLVARLKALIPTSTGDLRHEPTGIAASRGSGSELPRNREGHQGSGLQAWSVGRGLASYIEEAGTRQRQLFR